MLRQSALASEERGLVNLSFDITREYYIEIDTLFANEWREKSGEYLPVHTTHAGSFSQANAVIEGEPADVVTLSTAMAIDKIAKDTGKIPADWRRKFPNNSCPFASIIVFLLRKGNPKAVRDWDELATKDLTIVMTDPRTSGLAKYNYLSAWAYYARKFNNDEKKILTALRDIPRKILRRRSGSRGSSFDFLQGGIGDVLITFESEALLALSEFDDKFQIVYPSVSLLVPLPVAIVEGNAIPEGKGDLAKAYVNFLFSPKGQAVAAKHFFRPTFPQYARTSDLSKIPKVDYVTLQDAFGDWNAIQRKHFDKGGTYEQLRASSDKK